MQQIDHSIFHVHVYFSFVYLFKFVTYRFTICVTWNVFTGDDIQLSADINFISTEAILTLINKD